MKSGSQEIRPGFGRVFFFPFFYVFADICGKHLKLLYGLPEVVVIDGRISVKGGPAGVARDRHYFPLGYAGPPGVRRERVPEVVKHGAVPDRSAVFDPRLLAGFLQRVPYSPERLPVVLEEVPFPASIRQSSGHRLQELVELRVDWDPPLKIHLLPGQPHDLPPPHPGMERHGDNPFQGVQRRVNEGLAFFPR